MTVTVAKLPLPTARIRVQVFQDNAPLDGMWDSTEPGLAGFQVTIDDAGGTYGMSGGHQSTDAFGNKIGTTYKPCSDARPCDAYEVAQLGDGFVLTDADGYRGDREPAHGQVHRQGPRARRRASGSRPRRSKASPASTRG